VRKLILPMVQKIRAAVAERARSRAWLLNYRQDGSPFVNELIITLCLTRRASCLPLSAAK